MRFFCAVFSFLALAACGSADAKTSDRPALSVEYFQQDSARVIARWARPCDSKGCADSYRLRWVPERAGSLIVDRTVARLVDTLNVARPAIGDSMYISISVISVRRGISGPPRTARALVRNPDAAPPGVDSLRADTTEALAAEIDSFPVLAFRDTLGQRRTAYQLSVGDTLQICVLSRNRYTGEVRVFVDAEGSVEEEDRIGRQCEAARQLYAAERDG